MSPSSSLKIRSTRAPNSRSIASFKRDMSWRSCRSHSYVKLSMAPKILAANPAVEPLRGQLAATLVVKHALCCLEGFLL
jgi:hypothetical protein